MSYDSAVYSRQSCAAAVSLLLGRIGRWCGREIDAPQTERLGRSCLSIACSAISLARSAKAERDNESCFFSSAPGGARAAPPFSVAVTKADELHDLLTGGATAPTTGRARLGLPARSRNGERYTHSGETFASCRPTCLILGDRAQSTSKQSDVNTRAIPSPTRTGSAAPAAALPALYSPSVRTP